jgi:hypothetical protein
MAEKLYGECPLCEARVDMHGGISRTKHSSWHLRRERDSHPTLHVTIESKPLGIAVADEMIVFHCPICGKEL